MPFPSLAPNHDMDSYVLPHPCSHPASQGCSYEEVVHAIIQAGGPVDGGTKAESVRLHDDKV